MSTLLVFGTIAAYFSLLMVVAFLVTRGSSNQNFFTANKSSPWYVVAFAMIGTSLSGVTFISVPGWVKASGFSYMQMVMGYLVGYLTIAFVLLPLYYKLGFASIYGFLGQRFGGWSHKTGSAFFLLSRSIGASFRLYLVVVVLQLAFFDAFDLPFWLTVVVTIALIWSYTARGGIQTLVWTDTLQTVFMLGALGATFYLVSKELGFNFSQAVSAIKAHPYSQWWYWDWTSSYFFGKQFLSGVFISIVMTGLDQDMMQKNLTCRTLQGAQKNVLSLSVALVPINLLFLSLGVLLYMYAERHGIALPPKADGLYPMLATQYFPPAIGVIFLIGIIAVTFSSADSALTSLTTAFCLDFLDFGQSESPAEVRKRHWVHIGFSVLLFVIINIFYLTNDDSVISAVFTAAGYTYGPLLGLFAYGLFTKWRVYDKIVPLAAIVSPIFSYFLNKYSKELFNGYVFGFELLIVNGALMFLLLALSSFIPKKEIL